MNTDEPQTLKLSVSGMANVTASDIDAPSQVEIMNKKRAYRHSYFQRVKIKH